MLNRDACASIIVQIQISIHYEKWLNTLWYGHTMEYYAARNKSTATQNMEELHPCDVEQKKPREKTVYSD